MTLNQARRQIAVEQAKKETIKELKEMAMKGIQFQMELAMLLYLHDKEGFGKVRCERTLNGFEEAWDSLNREYCTLDDVAEMVRNEIGLEISQEELDIVMGRKAYNIKATKEF